MRKILINSYADFAEKGHWTISIDSAEKIAFFCKEERDFFENSYWSLRYTCQFDEDERITIETARDMLSELLGKKK